MSLTVTVSSNNGTPTGTVNVVDQATSAVIASGALTGGQAILAYTPAQPRVMTLTAGYAGDSAFASSQSVFVPLEVKSATADVSLKLSKKSGKPKKKVTATVKVAAVNGIQATGPVKLTDGGKVVATATLAGGQATLKYKPKKYGKHKLQATYDGDTTYAAGKSSKVTYTVK